MSFFNELPDPDDSWLDFKITGYDEGYEGGDYSVWTVYRRPGKIRKWLREIGLDRSTWQYKLVEMRTTVGGGDGES